MRYITSDILKDLDKKMKQVLPKQLESICMFPIFRQKETNEYWGILGMSIYTKDKIWDEYDKLVFDTFGNITS